MILGQSLDRFEKVGGERELVAQVSLAGLNERMVLPQGFENMLGSVHILAVSAMQYNESESFPVKKFLNEEI